MLLACSATSTYTDTFAPCPLGSSNTTFVCSHDSNSVTSAPPTCTTHDATAGPVPKFEPVSVTCTCSPFSSSPHLRAFVGAMVRMLGGPTDRPGIEPVWSAAAPSHN